MDKLKALTAKKKAQNLQAKAERTAAGGPQFVRRGAILEEQEKKYLEEKAALDEKKKEKEMEHMENLKVYFKKRKVDHHVGMEDVGIVEPMMFDDDAAEPPVPLIEIIARLRDIQYPIFLFGETRMQSYKRLLMLERVNKTKQRHKDSTTNDLKNQGQVNVHLEEMIKEEKGEAVEEDSDNDIDELEVGEDDNSKNQAYLYKWARRWLKEWQEYLAKRSEEDRIKPEGKFETGQYRQSRRDLKPLMKKLKHRELDPKIAQMILDMAQYADAKDYIKAGEKYMELSIGNAAWPVGVNRINIHCRAGATKIGNATGDVAHILGDETTRKFMMVIKRLLTLAERLYPPEKSKK